MIKLPLLKRYENILQFTPTKTVLKILDYSINVLQYNNSYLSLYRIPLLSGQECYTVRYLTNIKKIFYFSNAMIIGLKDGRLIILDQNIKEIAVSSVLNKTNSNNKDKISYFLNNGNGIKLGNTCSMNKDLAIENLTLYSNVANFKDSKNKDDDLMDIKSVERVDEILENNYKDNQLANTNDNSSNIKVGSSYTASIESDINRRKSSANIIDNSSNIKVGSSYTASIESDINCGKPSTYTTDNSSNTKVGSNITNIEKDVNCGKPSTYTTDYPSNTKSKLNNTSIESDINSRKSSTISILLSFNNIKDIKEFSNELIVILDSECLIINMDNFNMTSFNRSYFESIYRSSLYKKDVEIPENSLTNKLSKIYNSFKNKLKDTLVKSSLKLVDVSIINKHLAFVFYLDGYFLLYKGFVLKLTGFAGFFDIYITQCNDRCSINSGCMHIDRQYYEIYIVEDKIVLNLHDFRANVSSIKEFDFTNGYTESFKCVNSIEVLDQEVTKMKFKSFDIFLKENDFYIDFPATNLLSDIVCGSSTVLDRVNNEVSMDIIKVDKEINEKLSCSDIDDELAIIEFISYLERFRNVSNIINKTNKKLFSDENNESYSRRDSLEDRNHEVASYEDGHGKCNKSEYQNNEVASYEDGHGKCNKSEYQNNEVASYEDGHGKCNKSDYQNNEVASCEDAHRERKKSDYQNNEVARCKDAHRESKKSDYKARKDGEYKNNEVASCKDAYRESEKSDCKSSKRSKLDNNNLLDSCRDNVLDSSIEKDETYCYIDILEKEDQEIQSNKNKKLPNISKNISTGCISSSVDTIKPKESKKKDNLSGKYVDSFSNETILPNRNTISCNTSCRWYSGKYSLRFSNLFLSTAVYYTLRYYIKTPLLNSFKSIGAIQVDNILQWNLENYLFDFFTTVSDKLITLNCKVESIDDLVATINKYREQNCELIKKLTLTQSAPDKCKSKEFLNQNDVLDLASKGNIRDGIIRDCIESLHCEISNRIDCIEKSINTELSNISNRNETSHKNINFTTSCLSPINMNSSQSIDNSVETSRTKRYIKAIEIKKKMKNNKDTNQLSQISCQEQSNSIQNPLDSSNTVANKDKNFGSTSNTITCIYFDILLINRSYSVLMSCEYLPHSLSVLLVKLVLLEDLSLIQDKKKVIEFLIEFIKENCTHDAIQSRFHKSSFLVEKFNGFTDSDIEGIDNVKKTNEDLVILKDEKLPENSQHSSISSTERSHLPNKTEYSILYNNEVQSLYNSVDSIDKKEYASSNKNLKKDKSRMIKGTKETTRIDRTSDKLGFIPTSIDIDNYSEDEQFYYSLPFKIVQKLDHLVASITFIQIKDNYWGSRLPYLVWYHFNTKLISKSNKSKKFSSSMYKDIAEVLEKLNRNDLSTKLLYSVFLVTKERDLLCRISRVIEDFVFIHNKKLIDKSKIEKLLKLVPDSKN